MTDQGLGLLVTNAPPPIRQRRQRTNFTAETLKLLEELFEKNPYPDIIERENMAREFNTTEDRIQVWFQNKRARYRKKNLGKNNENQDGVLRKPRKTTQAVNRVSTPVAVKTDRSSIDYSTSPSSISSSTTHSTSTLSNDSAYVSFSASSSYQSPSISPQYSYYSYYGSTPNYSPVYYTSPIIPNYYQPPPPIDFSSPLVYQIKDSQQNKTNKPLFRPYE